MPIPDYHKGEIDRGQADHTEQDAAAKDSVERMEATGKAIVSDGEQCASRFVTQSLAVALVGTGLADNLARDLESFAIVDGGHHHQLPRLTGGSFWDQTYAADLLTRQASAPTRTGSSRSRSSASSAR